MSQKTITLFYHTDIACHEEALIDPSICEFDQDTMTVLCLACGAELPLLPSAPMEVCVESYPLSSMRYIVDTIWVEDG